MTPAVRMVRGVASVVRAGQTWKVRGGRRRVRVLRVRGLSGAQPWAELVEVSREGRRLRGRDRCGIPRGITFASHLSWQYFGPRTWGKPFVAGVWTLVGYECEKEKS